MKIFLQYILPLAFPASMYLLWGLYHQKKHGEESHVDLSKGPWVYLVGAGVALMTVMLVVMNAMDGEAPGGVYQSPQFKDGKVIPGHVIRDE